MSVGRHNTLSGGRGGGRKKGTTTTSSWQNYSLQPFRVRAAGTRRAQSRSMFEWDTPADDDEEEADRASGSVKTSVGYIPRVS